MKKITMLTFVLSLFMASSLMAQTTYYVKADATGANNGTSLADAFTTFGEVLAVSGPGDTIIVDGEVAQGGNSVTINYSLNIVGQNSAKVNGILGSQRLLYVNGSHTLNVSNLTFENFTYQQIAGVLYANNGAILIIDNCAFINNTTNHANGGGAINVVNSTCTITNSLFKGNSAGNATSGRGGAIYTTSTAAGTSNLSITNSTFYNNSAVGAGGAIYVSYNNGTFEAVNITVAKNSSESTTAESSGGIRFQGTISPSTLSNSLIFDNTENSLDTNVAMNIGGTALARPVITNSIVGVISNIINGGTITNSVVHLDAANLTLDYTDIAAGTDEVVKYADATYPVNFGDPTLLSPIVIDQKGASRDTGDSKIDAGAWASGFTNPVVLSVASNESDSDLSVFYSATSKTLTINNVFDQNVSVDVYSIIGAKVLSVSKINNNGIIEAGSLKSGIYILLAKSSNDKYVTKKFIVNN